MGIAVHMKCFGGRHTLSHTVLFRGPAGKLRSVWSVLEGNARLWVFGIRLGMWCEVARFKGSIAAFYHQSYPRCSDLNT